MKTKFTKNKDVKGMDPINISLAKMITALIKAKADDKLTEAQAKQFETLVKEIREKGPAAVQKKLRAELK